MEAGEDRARDGTSARPINDDPDRTGVARTDRLNMAKRCDLRRSFYSAFAVSSRSRSLSFWMTESSAISSRGLGGSALPRAFATSDSAAVINARLPSLKPLRDRRGPRRRCRGGRWRSIPSFRCSAPAIPGKSSMDDTQRCAPCGPTRLLQ